LSPAVTGSTMSTRDVRQSRIDSAELA